MRKAMSETEPGALAKQQALTRQCQPVKGVDRPLNAPFNQHAT